jgi:YD repeat-containing protein
VTYVYKAVFNPTLNPPSTGLQTEITENGHTTTQFWHAVGAPQQAWLLAVREPDGQGTWYEYKALGSLTKVTQPGVVRTWHDNESNRLHWQTQPESGTSLAT